jgi:hypothetical protein
MKSRIFTFIVFAAVLFGACSEENLLRPYGPNDGLAPGTVTVDGYTKIPGGVSIRYKAPADEDLMYIKAEYTLDTGRKMEVRASVYSDTLLIEGFADTETKEIALTAVDRFENAGETSKFEVVPGEPSYKKALETIETQATFGGISILMNNEDRGELVIDVLTQDSIGEWYSAYTEYTARNEVRFAVRGFDTIPREFRITVRDPWFNAAEALSCTVKPLFERQMELGRFKKFPLPTDTSVDEWGLSMDQLWSGQVAWGSYNMCHSNNFDSFPVWFTFDMGVKAKLSRYLYWQRLQEEYLYQHNNVKTWELWGHPDTPPLDGSWNGWIKLIECESIKPSGRPVGSISAEDIEYAAKGEEFEFPLDVPPVRYIRFKALSTFTGQKAIHIQQLWFFGQEVE